MTPRPRENGAVAFTEASASIGVESGKLVRELGRAAVIATMAFAPHSEGTSSSGRKSVEASGGKPQSVQTGASSPKSRG